MLILSGILLLLALVMLWWSTRLRRASGLPTGRLIYVDSNQWQPIVHPLFDSKYNLTGKPDYLIRHGDALIPIEVKSKKVEETPIAGHIWQLAAYCFLVQQCYGHRPPYGILHYPNRTYAIRYSSKMEKQVISTIMAMRDKKMKGTAPRRSHTSRSRCLYCGFREVCDERLA